MNSRTRILFALLATLFAGCVDVEHHEGKPWDVPELVVIDTTDETPDVHDVDDPAVGKPTIEPTPISYEYVLQLPSPVGCDVASLVGPADLDNEQTRCAALLVEAFGADGCLDERWTRSCEGALVADEHYEIIDPSAIEPMYYIPRSYYHQWQYDGGLLMEQTRANAPDEAPYFRESLTWDEQQRLVSRTQLNDPLFPEWERQFEERWTYHSNGEVIDFIQEGDEWQYGYSNTFGAAGELLETWKNENGVLYIQLRNVWIDGVLTSTETFDAAGAYTSASFEYDAQGRLTRKVEINVRNGWIDEWLFDDAERVLSHTQDSDRDGRVDYRETREWTVDGQEKLHRIEYDFDARGVADRTSETRTTFDTLLRPLQRLSTAAWHEGTTLRRRWAYDDTGVTTIDDELAGDGSVLVHYGTTRANADGSIAWTRNDLDRDGTAEWEERNHYDADGRLIETIQDHDGDGEPEYIRQLVFDRAGQAVREVVDFDGDRIADESRELRY